MAFCSSRKSFKEQLGDKSNLIKDNDLNINKIDIKYKLCDIIIIE